LTAYSGFQAARLPSLEYIFGQLAQVVADLRREGRSTHSAGVKPRLAQRLGGVFDEKAFGFTTFREFLAAAQRAGIIDIWPAPSGPDVMIELPGQPPSDVARHGAPVQIRNDLWATFMDWSPGLERAYDRAQGHAFRVSVAAEAYDPQVRELRQAMQTDRIRFVPIEPITMATQTEWARAFAAERPLGERDELIQALRANRPLQEFTRKIRTLPYLREWAAFRNQRVAEAIGAWAQQHQLTVDPVESSEGVHDEELPNGSATSSVVARAHPLPARSFGGRGAARTNGRQQTATGLDLGTLRKRAHELIECMTAEELLALPLSLGLLYRQ